MINHRESFISFLQYEKRFSPHTILAYRKDLDQFLTYLEKTYALSEIAEVQHLHIRSWMVELLSGGTAPRSVRRKLSTLKTYFRFLLKHRWISANPMIKVNVPKAGKRLPAMVQEKELDRLFRWTEFSSDFTGCRDRLILELLYATGIRRAELIALRWEDVEWEKGQLRISGKGQKERIIPFAPALGALLRQYRQIRNDTFPGSSYRQILLTGKGKPVYPKLVYNIVHRYLSQVTTVEQKSPHVLRHSFATHLSNNGADLNAIKELLGHANLAATQIYTHNTIEKLKNIYDLAHPKAKKGS